jgi:uncharacterized protein
LIFLPIERLLQEKREEILRIAARQGVRNIRVFGSAARGETREGSDIDLLIETGPHRTPWFPGGLIADLEELLGCRVDVVTEKALHWYLRDRVLQEARPL